MRVVVGITGASGIVYGVRLLEVLKAKGIETHLVLSNNAEKIAKNELDLTRKQIERLANYSYGLDDLESPISSGSFLVDAVIIVPCSMKTLAAIANGYADNLISRSADCALKEGKPLILVIRETPLNVIHLRNLMTAAECGAIILPAMPAFYHKPKSVNDVVDFVVGKILDRVGIKHNLYKRWKDVA
ncbi:MAG TPA: UbiX family flavin prenyltransferase [archaeon]|nr:UbiX family flavin prenyltransferase [archaeon]